jgi:UDP-N-acetylmuramoyl-L-alanyl-D-glutamate--2,6-diaminopimelate ligase
MSRLTTRTNSADRLASGSRTTSTSHSPGPRALRVIAVIGTRNLAGATTYLRAAQEATGRRVELINAEGPARVDADGIAEAFESMTASGRDTAIVVLNGGPPEGGRSLDDAVGAADVIIVTSLERDGATDEDMRRRAGRLVRRMRPGGLVVLPSEETQAGPLAASKLDVTVRFAGFGNLAWADLASRVETSSQGVREVVWAEEGDQGPGATIERRARVNVAGGRASRALLLAAAATPTLTDAGAEAVVAALESVDRVPGQVEPISEGQAFAVVSESAPTAGDLEDAVREARALTRDDGGRLLGLIAVDATSPLATLERALADLDRAILAPAPDLPARQRAWVSSMASDSIVIEPNRPQAIEMTLDQAAPGDAVLIVTSNPLRQTAAPRRKTIRRDPRAAATSTPTAPSPRARSRQKIA